MNGNETPTTNIYVLFCATGKEAVVASLLERMGLTTLLPKKVVRRTIGGTTREVTANLIPGYLFVKADEEPDWNEIAGLPGVLRPLWYSDEQHALRGSDLDFIVRLEKLDNVLDVSQVVRVGSKIEFVSGPLREMHGRVVEVNKHRKVVRVAFGDAVGSLIRTIWCPIEYLESHTETEGMVLDDSPGKP